MSEINWTDERCDELMRLMDVVSIAGRLNKSNRICENIEKLEKDCDSLTYDADKECFMGFLRGLAVAERQKRKEPASE